MNNVELIVHLELSEVCILVTFKMTIDFKVYQISRYYDFWMASHILYLAVNILYV